MKKSGFTMTVEQIVSHQQKHGLPIDPSIARIHRPDRASRLPHSQPQRAEQKTLERVLRPQAESQSRPLVRITSYRVKLLDEDNLRGGCKALADLLKVAGLIEDDSPEHIRLETPQVKVEKKAHQRTEIEIIFTNCAK